VRAHWPGDGRGRDGTRTFIMSEEQQIPLRAIVPNLITSMAACAGITSISFSSEGRFMPALWALLVACICDGIDGRVARLLNASSKLGAELDSLADFVNFGVAPAMFMYFWMTGGPAHILADGTVVPAPLIRIVLGCALYYAMCDCFRLARFNTMLEQPALPYWKHFFTGVPAPGGCWMVLTPAILSLALDARGISPAFAAFLQNPWTGIFMLIFVGSLMASRLPTISLKAVHISRRYLLPTMAGLLLLVALLVTNFWITLGVIGVGYILTVPLTGWCFLKVRAAWEKAHPEGIQEEEKPQFDL
jgi:CDP-diacylglycerol---serine O-phosphatidyltransferase